jgi:hypothetical protein
MMTLQKQFKHFLVMEKMQQIVVFFGARIGFWSRYCTGKFN